MTSMRWPTLWVAGSALLLLGGCGPSSEDYSDAVMLCAEQYRRFDSGRWDNEYDIDHAVTFRMSESSNSNMRQMADEALSSNGILMVMTWIPRRGQSIELNSDGVAENANADDHQMCVMGRSRNGRWHNISAALNQMQN